jgi:hypothetical protein
LELQSALVSRCGVCDLLAKVYAEHGGRAGEHMRLAVLRKHAAEQLHALVAGIVCPLKRGGVGQDVKARVGGAEPDEIASVCAAMHNAARMVADGVHDVSPATEGRNRVTVAHGLGIRCQIRVDTVPEECVTKIQWTKRWTARTAAARLPWRL